MADQEAQSAQAVANYLPETKARIDDLTLSAVDLLRQLPCVVQVEVGVQAHKPTHRIVHLRDWHFVPRDLYAIDMKSAAGRELSDADIDRLHRELLLEAEAVQLEQMALLRCLAKHHGLRRIYCEGLTSKDLPSYKEKVAVPRDMENTQISELRKQLRRVIVPTEARGGKPQPLLLRQLGQPLLRLLRVNATRTCPLNQRQRTLTPRRTSVGACR